MKIKKEALIKIAGFLLVPLVVMVLGVFFLYPYLNKQKYQDLVEKQEQQNFWGDSLDDYPKAYLEANYGGLYQDSMFVIRDTVAVADTAMINTLTFYKSENKRLQTKVDSLEFALADLQITYDKEVASHAAGLVADTGEDFTQKVKSLLNLDENEMSPILAKMNKNELVKLYKGGSTMQREKILRALHPDKAAEVMKEIML